MPGDFSWRLARSRPSRYQRSGRDEPFVLMPEQASHVQLAWSATIQSKWLEGLKERFKLVCYDGRGQGMSQRGLKAFSLADCLQASDLAAKIPGASLVLTEGSSNRIDAVQGLQAIGAFLTGLPAHAAPVSDAARDTGSLSLARSRSFASPLGARTSRLPQSL